MRVSWNWLSEFVDLSSLQGPQALADLLTAQGLEVESIERQDQGFEKVVIVQILERNPHPQSDRLSLCRVSLGAGDPLEIVCGAQNMKAGDKVALAQVGAHLPNGLKISSSKIRGVVSNGMLCSESELGLASESEGILILPAEAPLGIPLASWLKRDDVIFHLKLTANRGDCLSHLGVAREVGAGLGLPVKRPQALLFPEGQISPISVSLEAGDLAPQFWGCSIDGVKVGPSPDWVVRRLEALGSRSINNVVDATNLVMFELGQPVHAYDAALIQGSSLRVRLSQSGETLPTLDGQTLTLTGQELVISDQAGPVGLAGVMGGSRSEVSLQTQSLFLECAEFDPKKVRQASTRYQLKTEASHRFERGVDPAGPGFALARLATWIAQLAGGQVTGWVKKQLPSREILPRREIRLNPAFISEFLGIHSGPNSLSSEKIHRFLTALGCEIQALADSWIVYPPSYRLDLALPEDLAEEVARMMGYDQIPSSLPVLTSTPVAGVSSLQKLTVMDRAKDFLVQAGLNETLNYSFTSQAWLEKLSLTSSVKILNPLSAETEMMVPSLLPGLIRNALDNWNHHFGSEPLAIRLFELRPVFEAKQAIQAQGQLETGVQEKWKVALAITGPRYASALRSERGEVDYYDLKAIVERFFGALGTRGVRYLPLSESRTGGHALFHPGQSAEVWVGKLKVGVIGLFHPLYARQVKARADLWLAELDWDGIAQLSRTASQQPHFRSWPAFPFMERDFALLVKSDVTSERLCQVALKAGKPFAQEAKVFDIYRGSQVSEGMTSIAVRVIFYEESRSLQEPEVEAASAKILEAWKKELGAVLRG